MAGPISLRELDDEIADAELVDDTELAVVDQPAPQLLVDHDTVLYPGQALPTAADGPKTASGTCTSAKRLRRS
ncbi:hypothetical protein ACGFZH_18515 [Streptomyces zaomyceticus]|uniref:hypothetical protein n=1 Tax=Streptomyces zaomyceticus TaxID=68286 RepID=UPI00371E8A44